MKRISGHKFILALFAISIIYSGLFFCLRVLEHKSFFSFEYEDDSGHNQVVYNIATAFYPHQTVANNRYFFDHFTPIYFFVALFYKFYPHIYTWYFLISISYGFSSIIIYLLARDMVGCKGSAFVISLSYLLYSPLHYVNLGALDANQFSLPLLLFTYYFLHKNKFIPYLIFIILSCMCKEDIPPVIFLFGIYQLIKKFPRKWWVVTIVFSGLYFVLALYLSRKFCRIEGAGSGRINFDYIDLDTLKQIVSFIFFNTDEALKFMFNWFKARVYILLVSPLLFIPFFSLEIFIPLFMYAEVILSEGFLNENSYVLAPIIPFVFISLLFCLRRLSVKFGEKTVMRISFLILILCFLSNFGRNIPGLIAREQPDVEKIGDNKFMDVRNILDRHFYTIEEEDKIAWKFIDMIPNDASVAVSGDFLPALSSRNELYTFALNHPKAYESQSFAAYPDNSADYVLVRKKWLYNGMGGHYAFLTRREDLEDEIKNFINNYNFAVLKEEGDFVLLRNNSAK